jgi:hypothetical protein
MKKREFLNFKKNVEHYMLIFTKSEYFLNFLRMTQIFNINLSLKILIDFFDIVKSHKIRKMR